MPPRLMIKLNIHRSVIASPQGGVAISDNNTYSNMIAGSYTFEIATSLRSSQ
jgi:hypothetical protein